MQDFYNGMEAAGRGPASGSTVFAFQRAQELCPLFVSAERLGFASAFPHQQETIAQDNVLSHCHYLPRN